MKKAFILSVFLLLFFGILSFGANAEAKTIRVKGCYKPSTMKYVAPSQ